MVINSGARLCAVARMQICEVEKADDIDMRDISYKVISVADHKTSLQGPFQIPVSITEHNALMNVCKGTTSKVPDAKYSFVTGDGERYSVSRLNYEFQGVWRETGMLKKCGKFNCTDNRKRIASVLGQEYPNMREQTAQRLKDSVAIGREIYDHAVAAENAVKIIQHMEALDEAMASEKTASGTPEEEPGPCVPADPPAVENEATSDDNEGGFIRPEDRVKELAATLPSAFEEVRSEIVETGKDNTDAIDDEHFVSVSVIVSGSGKKIRRRKCSKSGLEDFQRDWKYEISLCKTLGKKPTITHIRQKLAEMPLVKARWHDLTEGNIKDKIWTESKRKVSE